MGHTISCPACKADITLNQLFCTATLFSFKCPHCRTRVQPENRSFGWLVIAGVVGALTGFAAAMIPGFVGDGAAQILAYVGLGILVVGAVVVIKWRASLALIKTGGLRVT